MSGVTAASLSLTALSEVVSKSLLALMLTALISRAAETAEASVTALARVATSEHFSVAKENQSTTWAESLVSLARVTGVWRREEEVATTTRSAPRMAMTSLVILREAARSFFQTLRPEMSPRERTSLVSLTAATTESSCSAALSRSMWIA